MLTLFSCFALSAKADLTVKPPWHLGFLSHTVQMTRSFSWHNLRIRLHTRPAPSARSWICASFCPRLSLGSPASSNRPKSVASPRPSPALAVALLSPIASASFFATSCSHALDFLPKPGQPLFTRVLYERLSRPHPATLI